MIKPLLKYLQRRLYSFLNSWWGFSFFLALLYLAIVRPISNVFSSPCSLRGGSSLFCSTINFSDNIASVNLESTLAYGPIDVVYTWVNGSDPVWLKKKELWTKKAQEASSPQESPAPDFNSTMFGNHTLSSLNGTAANTTTTGEEEDRDDSNRYRNSNELKYSLRSLVKNAPWIHHIYLVTDNQIPSWLNMETNKMSVVSHDQIFSNLSHLPVFSSPAIETHLHRIPNLSKKFIYFNDDVFLGAPVYPEDFVSLQGVQKLTMSWDVPKCAPGCSDSWIGDGYCDKACNVSSCNFDFPDCVNGSTGNSATHVGGKESRPVVHCIKGCPDNWLGDKICDARCKHAECAWDVGDCGIDLVLGQYPGGILTLSNSATTINGMSVDYYQHYHSIAQSHPHLLIDPVEVDEVVVSSSSTSGNSTTASDGSVDETGAAALNDTATSSNSSTDTIIVNSPVPPPTAAPTEPSYYHNYTKMLHVINRHSALFPPTPAPTETPVTAPTTATVSGDEIAGSYQPHHHSSANGTTDEVNQQDQRNPMHFMNDDMMGGSHYAHRHNYAGYDDSLYSSFFHPPEPVYGPPVVASVPVGTKAVYVDISMLPCLFQINSTCNPTQPDTFAPKTVEDIRGTNPFNKYNHHNNFQFSFAEHSDTENSIVQSVTLLQKHALLIVVLYSNQEEKPQPPPLPTNITLTVTGTQTTTGDTISTSFAIEITPVVVNDVQYPNLLPPEMHLINESYAAVVAASPTSPAHHPHASTDVNNVLAPPSTVLTVSSARVLKIPFSTRTHDAPEDNDASAVASGSAYAQWEEDFLNAETVSSNLAEAEAPAASLVEGEESEEVTVEEPMEGVVVELSVPHTQKLSVFVTGEIAVRFTITLRSEWQYTLTLPLCRAVMQLQDGPNHLPHFIPLYPSTTAADGSVQTTPCPAQFSDLLTDSHPTFLRHYYIEYSNLDPHSKLLVPPRETPAHLEAAGASNTEEGRLYLIVPMPKLQTSVKKQWVHWRVDLIKDTIIGTQATAQSGWKWSALNLNDTSVAHHVNTTSHHPEDVIHDNSSTSRTTTATTVDATLESKLVSVVGMVKWGSGSDVIAVTPQLEEPATAAAASAVNATSEDVSVIGNSTDANTTEGHSRRRLGEDTYAQSLIMVNRLYNKHFGNEARKVPAHLPHMIDRDIMTEMQTRYSAEWNATSTHRFRSSKDMQYSFSYYYYLIHRHKANPPDLKAFIGQFVDTNRNGYVDFNELRTLVAMMKGRTPQPGEIQHIHNCIVDTARNASIAAAAAAAASVNGTFESINGTSTSIGSSDSSVIAESAVGNSTADASSNGTESSTLSIMDQLKAYFKFHRYPTVDEVFACNEVRVLLKEKVEWDKRLPTHQILSDKDTVAFEMIGDNYTDTLSQLDSVRARQSKFICINDNMQKPSRELEEALQDFYLSYFPEPSIFELPAGQVNPTLYTDQYYRMRESWWFRLRQAVGALMLLFSGSSSSGSSSVSGVDGSEGVGGGAVVQLSRVSLFAGVLVVAVLVAIRTATRFTGKSGGSAAATGGKKKQKEHADLDLASKAKLREHNEGRFLHRHSLGEDYTVDDCEVEKRHAEVFTLGDPREFDLDEDDLNELEDEELAEQVRRAQRSAANTAANAGAGAATATKSRSSSEYDPSRNEWNENDLTAAETFSSMAHTGEEYLHALLRNVGWEGESEGRDGGAAGGGEASRDEEDDEEDEDSQDEQGRRCESFSVRIASIDKPMKPSSEAHRRLSGENQYVSMIPSSYSGGGTGSSYSSGAGSGYYSSGSDSSRNNSLSGERPLPPSPAAAAAPVSHKISFFSGSSKKKPAAAPASAAAAARSSPVPPPLPSVVQKNLVPVPTPSMRPGKSCLKRTGSSSSSSSTKRSVQFSNTIMIGDSAEPVTFVTNSPPRGAGGRKIMYRGQRVVEFVQGGLNLMKGILANPEGGSLYDSNSA